MTDHHAPHSRNDSAIKNRQARRPGYFRGKFGVEIAGQFKDGFDSLVSEKLATIVGDRIELSRAGLLRVDTLFPRFFEPQFQNVRYT